MEYFWDDQSIGTKVWIAPIDPGDLYFEVPEDLLVHGRHEVRYEVTLRNQFTEPSAIRVLTVDTVSPLLNTDSKLIFPPEILPPNKLTAQHLEPDDWIEPGVPPYISPCVGDHITWYWDISSSGTTVGGTKVLTEQDYDKPLKLRIEGDWIRARGDGDWNVWYTVKDRADNGPTGQSAVQMLHVNAQPVPRTLPPPKVVEASGNGWPVRGTLTPTDATDGVNIILNPESVIYPDEVPRVQWAVKNELGAHLADPVTPGEWKYKIPKEFMAPHFGKVIPVTYLFEDKLGKPYESDPYTLTVLNYPNDRLQAPQSADGNPLSLVAIPAAGASITLRKWPFSAVGQRISILVEGLEDASGKTIRIAALDKHEVNQDQAGAGIAKGEALVAKADFLSKIRIGTQLTVKAYVSFDNGLTWNGQPEPNPAVAQFPWLRVTLVA